MSFTGYEMALSGIVPVVRPEEMILADIDSLIARPDADDNEAKLKQIELRIAQGERLARRRRYEAALHKYKEARGLIYQMLYPNLNLDSYIHHRVYQLLPFNRQIQQSLLQVSSELLDTIRPKTIEPASVSAVRGPAMDDVLTIHTRNGYREIVSIEADIQRASENAIALIQEGKPEAAVQLLETTRASIRNGAVEPALMAALDLNLATGYVQAGNSRSASKMANLALESFQKAEDVVGQAQALHVAAISFEQSGNADQADQLFKQAANLLQEGNQNRRLSEARAINTNTPTRLASENRLTLAKLPAISLEATAATKLSTNLFRRPPISRDLAELDPIAKMDRQTITYRLPGRDEGWGTLAILDEADRNRIGKAWLVGVPTGKKITEFRVGHRERPRENEILEAVYVGRQNATFFAELEFNLIDASSTTIYLTHLYGYTLPLKIGDIYHKLGQFRLAEMNYRQVIDYRHLNPQIEASTLWLRIARNALEWGHALYKREDLIGARTQYEKLITGLGTVPNSILYSSASLSVPADDARTLIENILVRPLPAINWEIAIYVLTAHQFVQQILNGLDFYGLALSPIHTFEYLQGVARGFAQETIQAEREFVNFKTREEGEAATRRELESTKAMAEAEADARLQQYLAAQEDEAAAQHALDLAIRRRDDAISQRNDYASTSATQIWAQAAAQALAGGEDAFYDEISELADKLARGETISGPGPKLAAAQTLQSGRRTREYELDKMQDNINQLTEGVNIAQDQRDSAAFRTSAAEIAWQAALQRAALADSALDAFDDEFFTPETWSKMADVMRDISRSYLFRAIRIAKLMERAYNFENDTQFKIIKDEYGHSIGNADQGEDDRLLGGDSLLKDIDSFTFRAITTKTRKTSQIKDVISLAADFPAHFNQFLNTGLLTVETDLYEFDRLHPGFYGQRVEAVEVQFIGALPDDGVNGTLTIGGVTKYRRQNASTAQRVHQVDTMALSDFVLRNDAFIYRAETGVRGLFQGFGLGATWQIHLPRRSNNFDLRRIFDVQIVLYYTAQFDPVLRTHILNLPPRTDELTRLRSYSLRHDFPDIWYSYYQEGVARLTLTRFQLPANQENFSIQRANFRVVTQNGVSNAGIQLEVTAPNGVSGIVTTDAMGTVSSDDAALAGLAGTNPLGDWQIAMIGGLPVDDDGAMILDSVYNIQLGLEYAFEYPAEEI